MRDMETKEKLRVLKNGAVYDMEKKRIVANPGGGTAAITKRTASEMADIRRKRKQATIAAAANAAVERDDWRAHGDMAFVAAIADTAYIKATTPDDPKAIDAARFLLQETGLIEPKQAEQAGTADAMGLAVTLLRELAAFASTVESAVIASKPDAVDGEIVADDGGE